MNHTAITGRREFDLGNSLPLDSIEESVIGGEFRKASGYESIGDPVPVAAPRFRRSRDQLAQMTIFPVNVRSLMDGVIDLEESVGLAAHRTVTEQSSGDDRVLHSRQTSHGIADCTYNV